MTPSPPRIADIMTTDLLYYDEGCAAECYRFCRQRDIDCLPAIGDPIYFYRRDDAHGGFLQDWVTEDRLVDAQTSIFKSDLLERFRRQPVQFVFDHGEPAGVVHFSDYNRGPVSAYLYAQLTAYEQSLRDLAVVNKLEPKHMSAYLDDMARATEGTDDHSYYKGRGRLLIRKAGRMPQANPFQVYDLHDLIGMTSYRGSLALSFDVVELQYMVMRLNRLADGADPAADDLYIFDFATFEIFFNRALLLLNDSRRVRNRQAIQTGLAAGGESWWRRMFRL